MNGKWPAATSISALLPWLGCIIKLSCSEAEAVGCDSLAYDALLDEYEPRAASGSSVCSGRCSAS